MIDTIICGSTLDTLKQMECESIDCCITSPPYWGLRSYSTDGQVWGGLDNCEHSFTSEKKVWHAKVTPQKEVYNPSYMWEGTEHGFCQLCNAWRGELGLEPTFQLYIEHLQTIFDEVYRVLKKTGTCWVNLGDSFNGSGNKHTNGKEVSASPAHKVDTISVKSLCNIPFRFAISMTDNKWIQRNTVIWHKPSCMPSSAKDRFTVDFEYVFLFSKSKKYYFEQQFEAQSPNNLIAHGKDGITAPSKKAEKYPDDIKAGKTAQAMRANREWQNILPNGRNKRTVWRINPQPFKDAHFAVFPEKLVEPMIKAGCPMEICDSCGVAFKNMTVNNAYSTYRPREESNINNSPIGPHRKVGCHYQEWLDKNPPIKELKKCNCAAPTHAGIVLDPFSGSGTTCLVARKLQRHYIGIDLQPDYCKMAEKRLAEVL